MRDFGILLAATMVCARAPSICARAFATVPSELVTRPTPTDSWGSDVARPRAGEESRHGASQPEDERKAQQTKLRLLPSVRRVLDRRARARGMTASAYVSALVMADAAEE